jgi:hypothetical protein
MDALANPTFWWTLFFLVIYTIGVVGLAVSIARGK